MFEAGKNYEFRLIEDGGEITFQGTVERVDHPLIKLADTPAMKMETTKKADGRMVFATVEDPDAPQHPGRIINVTSPNFVRAVEVLDRSDEPEAETGFQTEVRSDLKRT